MFVNVLIFAVLFEVYSSEIDAANENTITLNRSTPLPEKINNLDVERNEDQYHGFMITESNKDNGNLESHAQRRTYTEKHIFRQDPNDTALTTDFDRLIGDLNSKIENTKLNHDSNSTIVYKDYMFGIVRIASKYPLQHSLKQKTSPPEKEISVDKFDNLSSEPERINLENRFLNGTNDFVDLKYDEDTELSLTNTENIHENIDNPTTDLTTTELEDFITEKNKVIVNTSQRSRKIETKLDWLDLEDTPAKMNVSNNTSNRRAQNLEIVDESSNDINLTTPIPKLSLGKCIKNTTIEEPIRQKLATSLETNKKLRSENSVLLNRLLNSRHNTFNQYTFIIPSPFFISNDNKNDREMYSPLDSDSKKTYETILNEALQKLKQRHKVSHASYHNGELLSKNTFIVPGVPLLPIPEIHLNKKHKTDSESIEKVYPKNKDPNKLYRKRNHKGNEDINTFKNNTLKINIESHDNDSINTLIKENDELDRNAEHRSKANYNTDSLTSNQMHYTNQHEKHNENNDTDITIKHHSVNEETTHKPGKNDSILLLESRILHNDFLEPTEYNTTTPPSYILVPTRRRTSEHVRLFKRTIDGTLLNFTTSADTDFRSGNLTREASVKVPEISNASKTISNIDGDDFITNNVNTEFPINVRMISTSNDESNDKDGLDFTTDSINTEASINILKISPSKNINSDRDDVDFTTDNISTESSTYDLKDSLLNNTISDIDGANSTADNVSTEASINFFKNSSLKNKVINGYDFTEDNVITESLRNDLIISPFNKTISDTGGDHFTTDNVSTDDSTDIHNISLIRRTYISSESDTFLNGEHRDNLNENSTETLNASSNNRTDLLISEHDDTSDIPIDSVTISGINCRDRANDTKTFDVIMAKNIINETNALNTTTETADPPNINHENRRGEYLKSNDTTVEQFKKDFTNTSDGDEATSSDEFTNHENSLPETLDSENITSNVSESTLTESIDEPLNSTSTYNQETDNTVEPIEINSNNDTEVTIPGQSSEDSPNMHAPIIV